MPSALRKIQLGQEAIAGTKVAASAKLLGTLTMEEALAQFRPEEERASFAPQHRTEIAGEDVNLRFEGALTYEQVAYLLNMAMKQNLYANMAGMTHGTHYDGTTYLSIAEALDGNPATYYIVPTFVHTTNYLYLGFASKFRAYQLVMGAVVNAIAATQTITCSDGSGGWLACALIRDGTLDAATGTKTWAKTGVVEFTPHANWLEDTVLVTKKYWIRIALSATPTADIRFVDFYYMADPPSTPCQWTFEPSLTSANTPQSFTIEYGDDVAEHEVEYAVARELRIRGAIDEPLRMEADIFARNMEASTFTSVSDPSAPESALMNKTRLYIDPIGGTIGDTVKAATLLDFNFSYRDFVPRKHGSDALYFDSLGEPKLWCRLEMTIDFNAGAETERGYYVAGTRRLFQIKASGSGGRELKINLAGVYASWGTLVDRDGADTVAVVVEGEYDPTWVKLCQVILTNLTAQLY